ncbi:MAG: polyprenyl synthetase family protein [Candidatus Omnitrophica bacterium]|nr:polyprenyl synthetase family protein [Candidatus Omnitrophota bacterium]
MKINNYLKEKKLLIDQALDYYLPSSKKRPKSLHQAMRYSIFSGGKRLRPLLVLIATEICAGKIKRAMPLACGLEMIHTYSLIHDDLPAMDNSDFRRGKKSCHKRFGEATAILAGDALLTLAFEILARTKNHQIITEVSQAIGSEGMVAGQIADLQYQGKSPNRKIVRYIREHKTGNLIAVSLKTGGILARANEKRIKHLTEFGKSFGITFQIYDDLKDRELKGEENIALTQIETLKKRMEKEASLLGKKGEILKELTDYIFRI